MREKKLRCGGGTRLGKNSGNRAGLMKTDTSSVATVTRKKSSDY